MADFSYLVHLNLNGNSLMNASFEKLATAPATPVVGQQYFDTATTQQLIWDGTAWKDVLGQLTVSANANTPSLTIDTTTPGAAVLAIADASATDSGLMTAAQKALVDGATAANTNDTIMTRDATGVTAVTNLTITGTPTNPTDAATKAYVDGVVTAGMSVKGSIDCSGSPNYPAGIVGDAYYCTADGRIGGVSGEVVNTGDLILCVVDSVAGNEATVGNNWIVLERNLEVASDTNAGIVRIATAAEVSAGTATDAVPTVNDVTTMISASTGANYIQDLATGSTSYTVTHNLNGSVIVQIYEKATGSYVTADIARVDANTITVTTNVALNSVHTIMCTYGGIQP